MTTTVLNLVCGLTGFLLGYFFARLDLVYVCLRAGLDTRSRPFVDSVQQPTSFFAAADKKARAESVTTQASKLGGISIDSSKVVTKIDTAGIERGSDVEFGQTTAQQDTLKDSVSKLSQLKGR